MKKIELHWKIIIGMVLGLIFGFILLQFEGGKNFSNNWIKPVGTIFIKLLKLIAIPLILASLIKGISDLKDISKFKLIGLRTIIVYICTTIIAISIGLILVNIFEPGDGVSAETVSKLTDSYSESKGVQQKLSTASEQKNIGPLQFIEDVVPDNAFQAFSDNRLMLQVIFVSIFLGLSMLLIVDYNSNLLKSIYNSIIIVV